MVKDRPEAKLVFAGDGPLRDVLEARISALGIAGSVTFLGWATSDQVREALRGATALVQPSFKEGLPVVIMEAMAQFRPVISTYIAGIPELVLPGETGWLVPAGDVDALAEAMRDCAAQDEGTLAKLGTAGAVRVRDRHDVAVGADLLNRRFLEVSGS